MKIVLWKQYVDLLLVISMCQFVAVAFFNDCVQSLTCQGVNYTSVRCSWTPPSDTQYSVQWILDSSTQTCKESMMIDDSYVCDINVLGFTDRYIKLVVTSDEGNKTFENHYSAKQCAIPNPPHNVQVEPLAASNAFKVTWTVPKDWSMDEETLLTYQVQYRSQFDKYGEWRTAQGRYSQTPPYTQDVVDLPYYCSSYEIKVVCKTNGVTGKMSAWSNIVSVRTTQLAPIGEMHDINFQRMHDKTDSRSILLKWKPIPLTKTCGPLLGYRVLVCTEECLTVRIPPNSTAYYVKDLHKYFEYNIYLSAYNAVGLSKSVNISIPALPVVQKAVNHKSRESYILYTCLIIPVVILIVILTRMAYHKLQSLFPTVPEPNIPSFPEYMQRSGIYESSYADKEFYTLLNESNEGNKSATQIVEVEKEKESVLQYRSVSVNDTGEVEVIEYKLLVCEDYEKPPSEKDASYDSCNNSGSISPYSKLTSQSLVNNSSDDIIMLDANNYVPNKPPSSMKIDSIIARQGEILEKKLQQRKCKFIVCRENGYAVIVEDVHQKKAEANV